MEAVRDLLPREAPIYPTPCSTWEHGYTVEVTPKQPPGPTWLHLSIGPISDRPVDLRLPVFPPQRQKLPNLFGRILVQLLDTQQVTLKVTGADRAGNTVAVPGDLEWEVSDRSLATLEDNGDGSYTLLTTGELGTVAVTVADDLTGDGDPEFIGSISFEIVAGPVASIAVEAGEPTDRP